MIVTLKDALQLPISCENKYGRRSMIPSNWRESPRHSVPHGVAIEMARKWKYPHSQNVPYNRITSEMK
jgi:hypothetical protein